MPSLRDLIPGTFDLTRGFAANAAHARATIMSSHPGLCRAPNATRTPRISTTSRAAPGFHRSRNFKLFSPHVFSLETKTAPSQPQLQTSNFKLPRSPKLRTAPNSQRSSNNRQPEPGNRNLAPDPSQLRPTSTNNSTAPQSTHRSSFPQRQSRSCHTGSRDNP